MLSGVGALPLRKEFKKLLDRVVPAFIRGLLDDSSAAEARATLGAAGSGANTDITSLAGLTTPLSVAQGGTGGSSAATARASLGTNDAANLTTGDIPVARLATPLNAPGSAPLFACRAWVNFNGTGTVAIRASGNVSSITDNGTGDYTVNFTTAMPDANFVMVPSRTYNNTYGAPATAGNDVMVGAKSTSTQRVYVGSVTSNINANFLPLDPVEVGLAFFR